MSQHSSIALFYYLLTIAIAMVLRIMSLSPLLDVWNPDWIMLVLIYWAMAVPERFGVFAAWGIGLLTDVLTGRLLGQYGLIYALIAYFSIKEHRRLRQFPIIQQCMFVFFCLLGAQSIIFGTESMKGSNHLTLEFWYPLLSGTLMWPAVFALLRIVRLEARIA
ncbi:rod shape-determining protein MreD [Methylomonas sp. AM2-LC]|uniref:rod shape-determining protein MreD n=1 Tax=Methylomonas sp. AM2-LC TaxID=3153301 RepID=UPI003267BA1F